RMERGWHVMPPELLIEVFAYLPTASLVSVTAVCSWWRSIAREDSLWREVFLNEFHSFVSTAPVCDVLADEYGMIKRGCPTTLAEVVEDFYYELNEVVFSPQGCFYAVAGQGAMICVYESSTRMLFEERDLHNSLGWRSVSSLSFSPDELCLAVRGVKANGKEELATFSICLVESCLHFISRLPSARFAPWFNNQWILAHDVYPMDFRSQVIKSISHLQLYKRHSSKKEALLNPRTVPLMKVYNEHEEIFNLIVSPFVSRRFRRVIEMAKEAAIEEKSLASKMNELNLIDQTVNEETQMDKLKQLLDREELCFECYISRDCERGCECKCHVGRDESLLIYGKHTDDIRSRICFTIVDLHKVHTAIENAENEEKEGRREVEDPTPDDDLYSYLSRHTTAPDHEITLDGRLLHLTISPDYKYLYATVNMTPRSESPLTEIRSFDLQTMVAERSSFYGGLSPFPNTTTPTSANSAFLFSCTEDQVVVWSRVHHGPSLTRLAHPHPVRSVAAHPHAKLLLVASGEQLHIWTPAFS
ncbi:hypothetical protein PFISCL1PPCAC_24031, partial [Pristionchus fissidentatus]